MNGYTNIFECYFFRQRFKGEKLIFTSCLHSWTMKLSEECYRNLFHERQMHVYLAAAVELGCLYYPLVYPISLVTRYGVLYVYHLFGRYLDILICYTEC